MECVVNIKKLTFIFIASTILFFIIGYVRSIYGVQFSTTFGIIGYSAFFLVLIFYKKKDNVFSIFLALIIPILLINIPIRIISFESSLRTLPENILYVITIIVIYFLFNKRILNIKTSTMVFVFISLSGSLIVNLTYEKWLEYLDWRIFERNTITKLANEVNVIDEMGNEDFLRNVNTTLVLNFWNTSCIPCIREFPEYQNISIKYPKVLFYAINIPIRKENPEDVFRITKSQNYTFRSVIAKDSSLHKKIDVRVFPTTIVIDKNKNIIFRGSLDKLPSVLNKI